MTDRPIIFSAPMIRALLDGRKTQTRRVLKLPTHTSGKHSHRIYAHPKMGGWEPTTSGGGECFTIARDGTRLLSPERVAIWHRTCGECIETPWQAGDRLWVRENILQSLSSTSSPSGEWESFWHNEKVEYLADEPTPQQRRLHPDRMYSAWMGKRPSIHMPRWASRLTLDVAAVKVERLQDLSEADAVAEGVWNTLHPDGRCEWMPPANDEYINSARFAFADLWQTIHGPASWSANPWVAAITFTVDRANIDALPERAAA